MDGCEPCVAGAGRTLPLSLDVREECEDKRDVQLLDRELGWPDAEAIGGKADQELEGISIGVAGVWAGFALARQVLAEKATEMGSEHRHALTPLSRISPASATSRS